MDLRNNNRVRFSGFNSEEVGKMEQLLKEKGAEAYDQFFCKKLAGIFNRSNGRAGKPAVKWSEVEHWLRTRHRYMLSLEALDKSSEKQPVALNACSKSGENEVLQVEKDTESSDDGMEFEARSSKDGAWYDVDTFLAHKYLSSGEAEVLVRFIGFDEEEDEWINVRHDVRERSIALEDSECNIVRIGEPVLCFQEQKELARYYDAYVTNIQRRLHDVRGCRCLYTIRYDRGDTEESVTLKSLCFRPSILTRPVKKPTSAS